MEFKMYGVFEVASGKKPELRVAFASKELAEQYAKCIKPLKKTVDQYARLTTIVKPMSGVYSGSIDDLKPEEPAESQD